MIKLSYAQYILNGLFHTGGAVGVTPEDELKDLNAMGVPTSGYSPNDFFVAFKNNDYKKDENYEKTAKEHKDLVNKSAWYKTYDIDNQLFKYEVSGASGSTTQQIVYFSGWDIIKKSEQTTYYPTKAFLALFTTMPNSDGTGYVEPTIVEDKETTYMRVDLHSGVITGNQCLNKAQIDGENGGAVLTNCEIIMYPEVSGVSWGSIVGFGVFETKEPMVGDPIFWGSISNGPVLTTTEHVPLFRIGDFKITLS